jgi:hypothetical protein
MNFAGGDVMSADLRKVEVEIDCAEWENSLRLTCTPWLTVFRLKQLIKEEKDIPEDNQQIYWSNGLLEEELFLNEIISKIQSTDGYDINDSLKFVLEITKGVKLVKKLTVSPCQQIDSLINSISLAFDKKIKPAKKNLGVSGLYQLKNVSRSVIALFKPIDEEPILECDEQLSSLNVSQLSVPLESISRTDSYRDESIKNMQLLKSNKKGKNIGLPSVRKGIYSGELASREVAAYLLDNKGIHCVPPTCMIEIDGSLFQNKDIDQFPPANKKGSCQKFISNNGVASNINYSKFSSYEVQKIAILDLRILNCDRNEANILFKRQPNSEMVELVPIDHGLSLPDTLEVYERDLIWTSWPQAFEPIAPNLLEYIISLNPKEDFNKLKNNLNIRSVCLRNFRIAEIFLIKCAQKGLSLGRIGKIMYRKNEEARSSLEKIIEQTEFIYKKIVKTVGKDFYIFSQIGNCKNKTDRHCNFDAGRNRFSSYATPLERTPVVRNFYERHEMTCLGTPQNLRLKKGTYSDFIIKDISSSIRSLSQKLDFTKGQTVPDMGALNVLQNNHEDFKFNFLEGTASNNTVKEIDNFNSVSIFDDACFQFEMIKPVQIKINEFTPNLDVFTSQSDVNGNKENFLTKSPIKLLETTPKNSTYNSFKFATPIAKPTKIKVSDIPLAKHLLNNESETISKSVCKDENTSTAVDETTDLGIELWGTANRNPHSIQRSLSIQEKQFGEETPIKKTSLEEGSRPLVNSDDSNDDLFFYFFESYVDLFLDKYVSLKKRRFTYDSCDYQNL